jgi:hypothetical protein
VVCGYNVDGALAPEENEMVTVTPDQTTPFGGIDNTGTLMSVDGSLALSGNYGGAATHGDTMDLSKLGVSSSQLPVKVRVYEAPAAGVLATGYIFIYCHGTTQANGVLQIQTAIGTEFTEGNPYNTTFANSNLRFKAFFPSLV